MNNSNNKFRGHNTDAALTSLVSANLVSYHAVSFKFDNREEEVKFELNYEALGGYRAETLVEDIAGWTSLDTKDLSTGDSIAVWNAIASEVVRTTKVASKAEDKYCKANNTYKLKDFGSDSEGTITIASIVKEGKEVLDVDMYERAIARDLRDGTNEAPKYKEHLEKMAGVEREKFDASDIFEDKEEETKSESKKSETKTEAKTETKEESKEGLSTGGKVAMGLGIAAGVGLAIFGIVKAFSK